MAVGNVTIWKPLPSTLLCSIAVTKIISGVLEKNDIPSAIAGLVTGGKDVDLSFSLCFLTSTMPALVAAYSST